MSMSRRPEGVQVLRSITEALHYCGQRARLRRTLTIAIVVGTILTLGNQGDVLLAGGASTVTALKVATNYLTPFIVSNLGLLSGRSGAA